MYSNNDQERLAKERLSPPLYLPAGFLWGASTSAYQIEGATREDGREPSIWDAFAATPGKTHRGETGDIADDHYHRVSEDLAIMAQLGLRSYCFSLAWPRVLPLGTGTVNAKGLDFYDRLVDGLLQHHITPIAKLYHWDLPLALQERGGWRNRDTAYAFADYADVVTARLGDRVQHWITHNEPFCTSYLGHVLGIHAPGLTDPQLGVDVAHHVLLSHGLAVAPIRTNSSPAARVGISLDYYPVYAADNRPETLQAVEQADAFRNRWFFDPIFTGHYPDQLFTCLGVEPPPMQPGDLAIISTPIDFLGLNYYSRWVVQPFDGQVNVTKEHANQRYQVIEKLPDATYTQTNWEVFPQGLLAALQRIHRDYAPPAIFITESGSAFLDSWDGSTSLHDPQRTCYLRDHIHSIARACAEGIPVQGYFVWSLLDNYEWAAGYSKRFGLIYVDFPTQKRIVKDSGHWYASFIASQH